MPGGGAFEQRRVIGDENAIKAVTVENAQHFDHVGVAVIDKHLMVVGDFALHIAQVDIGQFPGAAVAIHRRIDIRILHFRDGADTELNRAGRAGPEIQHLLEVIALVDQARHAT